MEQITIQDCGCIALPESVVIALDLRRGMVLDVALTNSGDAILMTPIPDMPANSESSAELSRPRCTILPPSR
jgi:hypothetical protein